MADQVKLKLNDNINVDEFLRFLEFHQFHYGTSKEEVLNFETLEYEEKTDLLVDKDAMEEFKVLVLVYKDLMANKDLRHLNIPIENSIVDYEKTRKINVSEGVDQEEQIADEIFAMANQGEAPAEKDMEDSFYGYKRKKRREQENYQNMDDTEVNETYPEHETIEGGKTLIRDIFVFLILVLIAAVLVLTFVLIR